MAVFYGAVQGHRGEATRLGTNGSGIRAQAQGWDEGVTVTGYPLGGFTQGFGLSANGGSHKRGNVRLGELRYRIVDDVTTLHLEPWIVEAIRAGANTVTVRGREAS